MYYEPGSESTGEAALAEIGRITAAFEAITAYLVMAVADLIGTDRNGCGSFRGTCERRLFSSK